MDELAPGIRQEVVENGYAHASGILAALARGEARNAAAKSSSAEVPPVDSGHTHGPLALVEVLTS